MHSRTAFGPCKIERRVGRAPRRRAGAPAPAMVTFAVSLSFGASSAAMAGPTGGVVVQGQGSISTPSTTQTVINQSSQQLTLNWSSFNVGSNESVRFYQPSSSSVAFNRILGQSASQIFGQIDANGQVVLINPNGLLIGRTAQLNVSSLVVSSLAAIDFNAARWECQ
jgi:filamentous hemagglutinin family protein